MSRGDAPAGPGAIHIVPLSAVNPLVVMREQAERYASNDRAMGLDPTQATTTAREALRAVEALVEAARAFRRDGWAPVANYSDNFWYMEGRPWEQIEAALAPFGEQP